MGAYGWFQTPSDTYNSMLQLTNIASSSPYPSGAQLNMTYAYSTTQNNGRIVSSVDAVSGENVSYTYDSSEPTSSSFPPFGSGPDPHGPVLRSYRN